MYKIAVVPGDGIGQEVVAEGVKVLKALQEVTDISFTLDYRDIGSERYLRTGELLTEEDVKFLKDHDAIYFGAIGDPGSSGDFGKRHFNLPAYFIRSVCQHAAFQSLAPLYALKG